MVGLFFWLLWRYGTEPTGPGRSSGYWFTVSTSQNLKNMAVPSQKQRHTCPCLALQLGSTKANGSELQHHTQPVDSCGAAPARKQPCPSNPVQPLNWLWTFFRCIGDSMDSLGLVTVISCIDQYQMHIIFNFYLLSRDNLFCSLHYDIEILHAPPKPKRVGQSKEVLHLWEDEER